MAGVRLLDPSQDDRIRAALRTAEQKGKLDVVAALVGIAAETLRKLMNSREPLSLVDRGTLGMHLYD